MREEIKWGLIVGLVGMALYLFCYFFLYYYLDFVLLPVAFFVALLWILSQVIGYNGDWILTMMIGLILVFAGYFLYGYFLTKVYCKYYSGPDGKSKVTFVSFCVLVVAVLSAIQFFLSYPLYLISEFSSNTVPGLINR